VAGGESEKPVQRFRWTFSGGTAPNDGESVVRGLTERDVHVVFQPIVDLTTGKLFAAEALVRCRRRGLENPVALFEAAEREHACGYLGNLIRQIAFSLVDDVPLFVNVHPQELGSRWLVRPDDPIQLQEKTVFMEITESAVFEYFDLCMSVAREIRARSGVRIVVDDLGAGYSNLKRIVDLEPDVVKLDRDLVHDIHKNKRQQLLVEKLVGLCVELGAKVCVEGIEKAEELSAIRDTGAHYAQGYFLAKPAYPMPNVNRAPWPPSRVNASPAQALPKKLSTMRR
jgi:EAL domain-containing protein (putative c-di-GMP-specific phosphodiesterase class I)